MTDDLERPADAVVTGEPDDGATGTASVAPTDPGHASLLAIVDRLGGLLERSDLTEIEVEVGGTAVILRKPTALAATAPAAAPAGSASAPAGIGAPTTDPVPAAPPARPSVKAPLTGIWYGSPAPGSAPFVEAGREIAIGQVVGLIEAMKLFNEIKSDLAGRVVRVVPESGALVKAKQPLIEVEPL
jgi:acetyl-CoA carboxylase biotin carboxyl carrier protein